jgi:hypothetical protein
MTIKDARIVDGSGRTVLAIAPERFLAWNEIDALAISDGRVSIVTTPRGVDPQLGIRLDGPFVLVRPPAWKEVAVIFGGLLLCLASLGWARDSRLVRLDERAASAWRIACAWPAWALAAAALLGTAAANAPVIFGGKSIVSPAYDVALLYGQNPWLPGYQSTDVRNPHGADVGALLWQHVPFSVLQRRALLQDVELPLWNRYDSAGLPLLGQGQSCFGDPLQVIPIMADGAFWSWDLKFLIAKGLFSLGVGLCAWRAFQHLPSAIAVAVSAAFMGAFVYRLIHPAIFSLCYAPWILYCWLRCVEARTARGAGLWMLGLIAVNWTEMNSGTAKVAYILLLSLNFSGFCVLVSSGRSLGEKLKLLSGLAAAAALFLMLASPIWFTFYRALKASYTSYNQPLAFQLQPGMALGLFNEAFFRPFQTISNVSDPSSNAFILLGMLWAAVCWRSLFANRVAAALLVSCIPALALVFGAVPPALIERVPFLGNILHIDNTFSCALIVLFSVLAAFGWREAWGRLATREGRGEAAVVIALFVALFGALLGTAQAVVRSDYFASTWGKLIHVDPLLVGYGWSLALGATVLLWALHRARASGSASASVVVLGLLGFISLHWREALQVRPGFDAYTVQTPRRVDHHVPSPSVDVILSHRDEPARAIGFRNSLFPGWSSVYDIEGITGPDALMNPYYREFMDACGVNRVWDWRYIVEPSEVARLRPYFDALNVRFYAGYDLGEKRPGKELSPIEAPDMDLYESRTAWPRAFFTDSAAVYKDLPQFCSWLNYGDGRPFVAIQLSEWEKLIPIPTVSGDLATRKVRAAENYRLTTNTTSFTVTATGPGFIVLTEAYEPGNFQVTLNGKRVPYLRVNHAFKGIYVSEAGTYEVRFAYWPKGLTTTLVLFGIASAVIAGALFAALFDRPRGAL